MVGFKQSTPLMRATAKGYMNLVKRLISAGADVFGHTPDGDSALHQAAAHGRVDIVEFLLDKGVPVDDPGLNVGTCPDNLSEHHDEVTSDKQGQSNNSPCKSGIFLLFVNFAQSLIFRDGLH